MNLLYLSLSPHMGITDPLGYGTHMREVARALAERGHRVQRYIAADGGLVGEDGRAAGAQAPARPPRRSPLEAPAASWHRPLAGATAPARHLLRDLRELWHDRQAPARLAPLLGAGIDAIYERSAFMQLAGLELARAHGLPHLLEVNAPIEERRDHHGFPLFALGVERERRKLAYADQVTCVTGPLRRYLIERGADPARVAVIPNGVRAEGFRIGAEARAERRAAWGVRDGQVVVGFVGRFGFWRGMIPLVEAAGRVAAAEPRAHFVLIGGGPMLPRVAAEIAARGLGARITLTGVLPPEAVPSQLAAFDLGVLAGSPWYSSPIKLFEYGAAGLAIVAPQVEAVAEVLEDGTEGLLVEPEDPAAIAAAIARLIADPGRRRSLGERYQARVLREFTWARAAARAEELLLGSPRWSAAKVPAASPHGPR
jgi:glycosyltransferase involved in cell wall biosynthesis